MHNKLTRVIIRRIPLSQILLTVRMVLRYYHNLDRTSTAHGHEQITVITRVMLLHCSVVIKFKTLVVKTYQVDPAETRYVVAIVARLRRDL